MSLTQRQSEVFTMKNNTTKTQQINLNFLHPIKELYFVIRRETDEGSENPQYRNYFWYEGACL